MSSACLRTSGNIKIYEASRYTIIRSLVTVKQIVLFFAGDKYSEQNHGEDSPNLIRS